MYIYVYTYICIYNRKLPALHGFVSRVAFGTARHCTWQAKNPHCTELHGTAWKVPVHVDPKVALLMELKSARRCPWQA